MDRDALFDLVQENFCRKVSWAAERHPLMRVLRLQGVFAVDCGLASDTFNVVVWPYVRSTPYEICPERHGGPRKSAGFELSGSGVSGVGAQEAEPYASGWDMVQEAASLEQVARYFEEDRRPAAFWVWDRPGLEAESLLLRLGLRKTEVNIAMWASCDAIAGQPVHEEQAQCSGLDLDIRPVRTARELAEYGANLARLFAGTPEAEAVLAYHTHFLAPVLWSAPAQEGTSRGFGADCETQDAMRLYCGWHNNQVVSTGLLFLGAESAGIYDLATRVEYRRRGIGSAMFRFLLGEGKRAGARFFVLQASPDGCSLYRRAGFQDLGRVLVFERAAQS